MRWRLWIRSLQSHQAPLLAAIVILMLGTIWTSAVRDLTQLESIFLQLFLVLLSVWASWWISRRLPPDSPVVYATLRRIRDCGETVNRLQMTVYQKTLVPALMAILQDFMQHLMSLCEEAKNQLGACKEDLLTLLGPELQDLKEYEDLVGELQTRAFTYQAVISNLENASDLSGERRQQLQQDCLKQMKDAIGGLLERIDDKKKRILPIQRSLVSGKPIQPVFVSDDQEILVSLFNTLLPRRSGKGDAPTASKGVPA